jgi:hypothetical protein
MAEYWVNLEVIWRDLFSNKGAAFAGKKKKVWDFEYCRVFGRHHVKAITGSGPYLSDYLNPKQLEMLAEADDE